MKKQKFSVFLKGESIVSSWGTVVFYSENGLFFEILKEMNMRKEFIYKERASVAVGCLPKRYFSFYLLKNTFLCVVKHQMLY